MCVCECVSGQTELMFLEGIAISLLSAELGEGQLLLVFPPHPFIIITTWFWRLKHTHALLLQPSPHYKLLFYHSFKYPHNKPTAYLWTSSLWYVFSPFFCSFRFSLCIFFSYCFIHHFFFSTQIFSILISSSSSALFASLLSSLFLSLELPLIH